MSKWKKCKLEDVADNLAMGPFGSNIKAENFKKTGVPVIRGTNLNYHRYLDGEFVFLTEEKANELKSSNCFPGDLVFTHRGTIGQVGIVPHGKYPRYVVSQSGMKVTPNSKLLDNMFLFYFFKSDIGQHELLQHESQVGVPSISSPLSSLKAVNLRLPPLPEQKAIASVLSCLDDKIDLLHRQNKTLEAMAEALFRQRFVEEEKDMWENKTLDAIANISIGRTPPRQEFQWFSKEPDDVKWISIKDLGTSGIFVFDTSEKLTRKAVDHFNIPTIPKNTVILSFKMTVGRVGITTEEMLSNEAIAHFVLHKNASPTREYLYFYLKLFKYDSLGSTSSIVTAINSSIIKKLIIKIPPKSIMQKFTKIVEEQFEKIRTNQMQIRTLEKNRDLLLPKLISGEARIEQ